MTDLRKLLIERRAAGGRQMTTGNAPTMPIVRQIELITERRDNALLIAERKSGDDREGWLDDAAGYDQVIASLEKLAALEKPVPVEPFRRFRGVLKPVDRGMWVNGPCDYYHDAEVDTRIDSLQSALKLAQEERDEWERKAGQYMDERDKAEAINRRMVEQYRDLVVAAHSAHQTLADEGFHAKALRLGQALAKLEEL